MNVISFALWGDNPMYYVGAVKNCLVARQHYRGWKLLFYVAPGLVHVSHILRALGAEVRPIAPAETTHDYLYYRMLPVLDHGVDCVLFRDCDSRLNEREAVCVKEWTDSDAPVHGIRDHRMHTAELMGGMWGCRPAALLRLAPDFDEQLQTYMSEIRDGTAPQMRRIGRMHYSDQTWLRNYLWPLVKDHALIHDNRRRITATERVIKHKLKNDWDFVGQAYNADGEPIWKP